MPSGDGERGGDVSSGTGSSVPLGSDQVSELVKPGQGRCPDHLVSLRALLLCQTSDASQLFGESPALAPRAAVARGKVWGPREGPPGVRGPKNTSVCQQVMLAQPPAGFCALSGTIKRQE